MAIVALKTSNNLMNDKPFYLSLIRVNLSRCSLAKPLKQYPGLCINNVPFASL